MHILVLILFSGQVIFALGGLINSYALMQIGRFVFGIGGESLAVAQNTYAVSWFKGKELNMVFGFQVRNISNILNRHFREDFMSTIIIVFKS